MPSAYIKLFHYTTSSCLAGILHQRVINPGQMVSIFGQVSHGYAVSLTSDTDPIGHGLPDGRVITAEQAQVVQSTNVGGILRCIDATECRIEVEVEREDARLFHAPAFYSPKVLRAVEVSAYFPLQSYVSTPEVRQAERAFRDRMWKPKGPTWYFYQGALTLSKFTVQRRQANGQYL